jgi:ABC-type branched-subunit amino acid transport system substrate-binding protein
MKPRILLLGPEGNDSSPQDQSDGARLVGRHGALRDFQLEEDLFQCEDLNALENKTCQWEGKLSGIVGATNVAQSTRLSEIAEQMNVLCFVANNNPSVWQRRRHTFHIGLPTSQTADAIGYLLAKQKFTRVFLLHDQTEFQNRVATSMKSALEKRNIQVSSASDTDQGWMDRVSASNAALVYMIYSAEKRALPLARACKSALPGTPILFGRSLLRQAFIESLGSAAEGALFVDLFRRGELRSPQEYAFMNALSRERVSVATANHGFGWDAMMLCSLALSSAQGNVPDAIDYLESGVSLEGVTGLFLFSKENHNGRHGFGPTRISRWHNGRLEEAFDA